MNYWNKLVKFLIGSTGSGVRAKDSKGRYIADDKSTVDVNEAYEDGKTPGVNIRMEAAKQILDRVGLVKKDKIDINAQVAHGIFILPPKDATN